MYHEPSNTEDVRDFEPLDDRPLLGLLVSAQVDLPRHHQRRHPRDQLRTRHLVRRYRLKLLKYITLRGRDNVASCSFHTMCGNLEATLM